MNQHDSPVYQFLFINVPQSVVHQNSGLLEWGESLPAPGGRGKRWIASATVEKVAQEGAKNRDVLSTCYDVQVVFSFYSILS